MTSPPTFTEINASTDCRFMEFCGFNIVYDPKFLSPESDVLLSGWIALGESGQNVAACLGNQSSSQKVFVVSQNGNPSEIYYFGFTDSDRVKQIWETHYEPNNMGFSPPPSPFLGIEEISLEELRSRKQLLIKAAKAKYFIHWQGFKIGVEVRVGDERFEKAMKVSYGYIEGHVGADKEALDVYIGHRLDSTKIFKIRQMQYENPELFDEEKYCILFESAEAAKKAYKHQMPAKLFGGIEEVDIDDIRGKKREAKLLTKEPSVEIAAGHVTETYTKEVWRAKLRTLEEVFSLFYQEAHYLPDSLFLKFYGKQDNTKTRQEIIDAEIEEYARLLKQHSRTCPLDRENHSAAIPNYHMAQSAEEPILIEAASRSPPQAQPITLECQANFAMGEEVGDSPIPFEGTIFRVDEPSESAPSGSNLPIYIPRYVAEAAFRQLAESEGGLPIDADPNLTKHNKENIVGVFTRGRVEGKNAIVSGSLWPWNRKGLVGNIRKAIASLGMSFNGKAYSQQGVVSGKKVSIITKLELLGTNILQSDRASFQKTRLIAAEKTMTTEPTNPQGLMPLLAKITDDANNRFNDRFDRQNSEIEGLKDTLAQFEQSLNTVTQYITTQQEREQQTLQAQARQEQTQQSHQAMSDAMEKVMGPIAQQMQAQQEQINSLVRSINPNYQPPRAVPTNVQPVASGAIDPEKERTYQLVQAQKEIQDLQSKYDFVRGQEAALAEEHDTSPNRIKAVRERQELAAELQRKYHHPLPV